VEPGRDRYCMPIVTFCQISYFFLPEWTEGKWGLCLWPDCEQKYGHCFAVSHFKLLSLKFLFYFSEKFEGFLLCQRNENTIAIAVSWNHLTEYAEVSPLGIGTVLTTSTSFTQKCVLLVSFAFRKQRTSEEKVMFFWFGSRLFSSLSRKVGMYIFFAGTQITNLQISEARQSENR
jgi:hypothetical protein